MSADTGGERSWPRVVGTALAALVVAVAVALGVSRYREDRAVDRLVATLLGGADDHVERTVGETDLSALPAPVERYVETVLEESSPRVPTARIQQRGEVRLDGDWRPFSAVQHVAVDPPGFVWDADVEMAPGVGVRVVDRYVAGEGGLRATLLSVLPVVEAPPEPSLSEAELARYLAECVWLPTALLDERVEWEAIDDSTARATIRDGERTASLTFEFDDRGLVERVHADARYRLDEDETAPWTGEFSEYRVRNGVLVPTEAEVRWDGEESYWRGTVESIAYGVEVTAGASEPAEPPAESGEGAPAAADT